MARQLTLVRHGESTYNAANRFTGWCDPDLTERGVAEAHSVARQLRGLAGSFDAAFSSALWRAQRTAQIILADLGYTSMKVVASPALNERNYGQLTGLDKDGARARWGAAQVQQWRRSYMHAPPEGESLRDTAARVLQFYVQQILPAVMRSRAVLVVAHGNSLRALVMALDGHSADEIGRIEIATGGVLTYELAADTTVMSKRSQVSTPQIGQPPSGPREIL